MLILLTIFLILELGCVVLLMESLFLVAFVAKAAGLARSSEALNSIFHFLFFVKWNLFFCFRFLLDLVCAFLGVVIPLIFLNFCVRLDWRHAWVLALFFARMFDFGFFYFKNLDDFHLSHYLIINNFDLINTVLHFYFEIIIHHNSFLLLF